MNIWLQLLWLSIGVYGALFVALLLKRRWTATGLVVGIVHLLLAMLFSVAPFRSFFDPAYEGFQLGLLRLEGQAATLPTALILAWALTSAATAVISSSRNWLLVIAAGDLLFAANQTAAMLLQPSIDRIQFGEFLTISGIASLAIMVLLLVGGPLASGAWAWRRARAH